MNKNLYLEPRHSREFETPSIDLSLNSYSQVNRESIDDMRCLRLVNFMPLSIIVTNQMGRVLFVNTEFVKTFGTKVSSGLQEALNNNLENNSKKMDENNKYVIISLTDGNNQGVKLIKKSGQEVWCHLTKSFLGPMEILDDQLVIDDLVELKLKEKNKREKIIAEEANQAKTDFLTNISHEIRTPLSAITGFVDLIMKKNNDPEINKYLETVKRNSQHLLLLVNDLLDLSKIESGQLDVNLFEFPLTQEIQSIIEMVQPLVLNRPIEIRVKYQGLIPKTITSDAQKFRQIFINIINNSIKYTKKGFIDLEISVSPSGSLRGQYLLKALIRDTGQGICSQQQKKLFTPFCRGREKEVLKTDGIGIGLALSRKLAFSLGGGIELIWSEVNRGSEFEIILPIGNLDNVILSRPNFFRFNNQSGVNSVSLSKNLPLRDKKILVVEDAEDIQILLDSLLKKNGASVSICNNGLMAEQTLEEEEFDLILMDIQMPIKDGMETVIDLRKKKYTGKIIALTAHAFKAERERCLKIGFDSFISKPFTEEQLISAISSATNQVKEGAEKPQEKKVNNSDEILKKAAVIFKTNAIKDLEQMKAFSDKEDWDSLSRISHKMKGSSACFGFTKLSGFCREIEEKSKIKENRGLDGLLRDIGLEIEKISL